MKKNEIFHSNGNECIEDLRVQKIVFVCIDVDIEA